MAYPGRMHRNGASANPTYLTGDITTGSYS